MKRLATYLSLLAMAVGILAFQCQSTEMTTAKLAIKQKNFPKAIAALQKEIKKNPKSDEGYFLLGKLYGDQGKYDEMVKNFDQSLKISNKYADQIRRIRLYHWAQNFNKGVKYFNKGSQAGTKKDATKAFDAAVKSFKNSIVCEPDSAVSYKNLAYALMNLGDVNKAVEPLQKLKTLNPEPDVYYRLGQIYLMNGVNRWNKYLDSKNPEDSVAAMNDYEKAITELKEGKSKYPDNSDILMLLSNAYIKANKLDVAMDAFAEGVKKQPNNKFYHYDYGVLLLGANRFEEAVTEFKKALEIDPNYQNALYNLAVTYVKWGSYINEQNIKNNVDSDNYKEKYKSAYPYLEQYLKKNPKHAAVWELLGKVYANIGMKDKSKEAFDKADALRK